jgi:hypothetical protein
MLEVPTEPFHRIETPSQPKAVALLQDLSKEILGRAARGSSLLAVKAYPGPLPPLRGIEFTTDIEPGRGSAPNEARWYLDWCPGVQLRQKDGEDFACITVTSFKNCQP